MELVSSFFTVFRFQQSSSRHFLSECSDAHHMSCNHDMKSCKTALVEWVCWEKFVNAFHCFNMEIFTSSQLLFSLFDISIWRSFNRFLFPICHIFCNKISVVSIKFSLLRDENVRCYNFYSLCRQITTTCRKWERRGSSERQTEPFISHKKTQRKSKFRSSAVNFNYL